MRACLVLAFIGIPLTVSAVTLDFEDLPEATLVTDQYRSFGIFFHHAIILTAGVNLDEWDYPPVSGSNVLSDVGGPITMTFALPVHSISFHTTYGVPLTIDIFGTDGHLFEALSSAFSSNALMSGDPGSQPNELVTYTNDAGIGALVLAGAATGQSFVLDDLSVTPLPETSSLLFLGVGLFFYLSLPHLRCARYKVTRCTHHTSRKGGRSL